MTENIKLFPAWKQAVKTLVEDGLTYGDRITKEQIIQLCDIKPAEDVEDVQRFSLEFLDCMSEIRDTLLTSHSMMLNSDQRGAYVVVHPKDQTGLVLSKGVKAMSREMRRMAEGVTFIRRDMLTNDEAAQNADAQAKVSRMADLINPVKSELQLLAHARLGT